jgi:branched-chain amino acid transport system substrate-binding protein
MEDDDLFFRTAPSDARQGQVIADILEDKGVKEIAITFTNNDYGKGLAESIEANFTKRGGKVTISAAHAGRCRISGSGRQGHHPRLARYRGL